MTTGIDNLEKSIKDVGDLLATGSEVLADGTISFSDITSIPALLSEAYHLFEDGKAAVAAGEIANLDIEKCKELLTDLLDLGSKIVSAVKPKA